MSDLFRYCNTDRQKEIIRLYESGPKPVCGKK